MKTKTKSSLTRDGYGTVDEIGVHLPLLEVIWYRTGRLDREAKLRIMKVLEEVTALEFDKHKEEY